MGMPLNAQGAALHVTYTYSCVCPRVPQLRLMGQVLSAALLPTRSSSALAMASSSASSYGLVGWCRSPPGPPPAPPLPSHSLYGYLAVVEPIGRLQEPQEGGVPSGGERVATVRVLPSLLLLGRVG